MGRKKRKIESLNATGGEEEDDKNNNAADDVIVTTAVNSASGVDGYESKVGSEGSTGQNIPEAVMDASLNEAAAVIESVVKADDSITKATTTAKTSSSYAMTSHSGELIQEDVYVSDGSVDSDDDVDNEIEVVLTGSRMGIMRRGLHHQMMALQQNQPNRQWKRQTQSGSAGDSATIVGSDGTIEVVTLDENGDFVYTSKGNVDALSFEELEAIKRQREEEELASLDPAQRAARLLLEKQRRELEAKIEERLVENEENVRRDPTLFSKRTAFDIRFDQIDDKPWQRNMTSGNGNYQNNHSEFFNYGLSEEEWMEYAAQQLIIRQELIDAYKQKRAPDPAIVIIQPRRPINTTTTEAASTTVKKDDDVELKEEVHALQDQKDKDSEMNEKETRTSSAGDQDTDANDGAVESTATETVTPLPLPPPTISTIVPEDDSIGIGGAWGAGAVPGSVLARLLEEQEEKNNESVSTSAVAATATSTEKVITKAVNADKNEVKQEEVSHPHNHHRGEDNDAQSYRSNNTREFGKPDRDYSSGGRYHQGRRRGSGGGNSDIADDTSTSQYGGDEQHMSEEYDHRYHRSGDGGHWKNRPPQGMPPPPPPPPPHTWGQPPPPPPPPPPQMDPYKNNYGPPPPYGGPGYQGGRGQGRGGRGSGGRFPPRGGGRGGGRGYNDRGGADGGRGYNDRGGADGGHGNGGGRDEYYQNEASQQQQHSGWKRPRGNDDDHRRRY